MNLLNSLRDLGIDMRRHHPRRCRAFEEAFWLLMVRKRVTMDRVFEIAKRINDDWTMLNRKLKEAILKDDLIALKDLHKKSDKLRNDFANLITMGQDDAWRFFADSNGVVLPEDEEE